MNASASRRSSSGNDDAITREIAVQRLLLLDDAAAQQAWIDHCLQHIAADTFFPYLKEESERYQKIDPYRALRLAEALTRGGASLDRAEYHALGLLAMGNALGCLGRYHEATEILDAAGDAFLNHGDEVGWARTRLWWLVASHRLGRGETAIAAVGRAREILVRHQSWLHAAGLDSNIAVVYEQLGRYDDALVLYESVQSIYERLGPSAEIRGAWTKVNKALLLTQFGDFTRALALLEEVRQIYVRHGATVSLLRQEHTIANIETGQGHYTRALLRYTETLAAFEEAGLDIDGAWVALNMVECYLSLNRNDEALALAREIIDRFEQHGTPTETAKAQFIAAVAYARSGDVPQALALLHESGEAFRAAGFVIQLAHITLQRAQLHLSAGEARTALGHAEDASDLFRARGSIIHQAHADLIRARAALALGDLDQASRLAQVILGVSAERDVQWLTYEAKHVLGAVADARGDRHEALRAYDEAVTSIEQMQRSLAVDLRTNFLADKMRVYDDAIAASLRLSQIETAFAYLERAKSRALVDYLANNMDVQIRARADTNQELAKQLARVREEHNWFYTRLFRDGVTQRTEDGSVSTDEQRLRSATRDRERQIVRLLERLALNRTEGLAIAVSADASASPRIPALSPDTVLIEYYFRDDAGMVFVVASGRVVAVPLTVRPVEIGRLLRQWQLNLRATAQAVGGAAPLDGLRRNACGILGALYRALIAPVSDYLAGYDRLIVVPFGFTHMVPFHALFDGARHLLERWEISMSPSANLLQICTSRPRRRVRSALVLAHSDGGRLPGVRDEARLVAARIPGEHFLEGEATRATFIDAAPRHSVIHLAAHGEARQDNPAFAHLKLADGQLSVVDILNLDVGGALVTLSACETGRSVIAGGDELVGLSRGFLYAGASTLVQSLWRVEDGSTTRLMDRFYREICNGKTKGGALREAQRALLMDGVSHPFLWAPFQLIGESGVL